MGCTPTYQWKKNGTNAGTNSATYTDAGLANGDKITCVMTSSEACASPTTATSNEIALRVTSPCVFTPSNITVAGFGCFGPNGTYTPNGTVNGAPAWRFSTFDFNIQWSSTNSRWEIFSTGQGTVSTNATGSITNLPCSTGWTDPQGCVAGGVVLTGGCGSLTVSSVTPSVSIVSDDADNSILSGTSVIFTATPTNGGTTPAYQWKKNGNNVGTNSATFTDVALVDGDKIACVLTSSNGCASTPTATSNEIAMTVNTSTGSCIHVTSTCGTVGGVYILQPDLYNDKPYYDDEDGNEIYYYSGSQSYPAGWYLDLSSGGDVLYNPSTEATIPLTGWKYYGNTCGTGGQDAVETFAWGECPSGACNIVVTTSCLNKYSQGFEGVYSQVNNSAGRPKLADADGNIIYYYIGGGGSYPDGWYLTDREDYTAYYNSSASLTVPTTGWQKFTVDGYNCSTSITVVENCGTSCVTPTAYNVTGSGAYCAGGLGVVVGLDGSETGVTYQLKNGTTDVGSPVSGTGAAITFGTQTTCTGTPKTFTITVNPTPSVTQPSNQAVCNAFATTAVTFTGSVTGTVYKWTNNNTSIGLAASGTGSIATFTGINTTDAVAVATITVTPYATFGGVECSGPSKTFTITVNPTPRITSITPMAPLCQGDNNGRIFLTVAGGTLPNTYSWIGTGFTATTTTTPDIYGVATGNYNVILADANGCQAFSSTYVPFGTPQISAPLSILIDPSQLNASGIAPTSVAGDLKITTGCFTATQVTFTDKVYDVHCGVALLPNGQPANINLDLSMATQAVEVIIRTFIAKNSSSQISYSAVQYIYVRSYKLTDVFVPNDQTLQCANSSTDPTITGKPSVFTGALGQGLANNLSATYTDERITNANGFTIKRTWVLKNECTGETRTVVQNLTYTVGTCPSATTFISGKIQREDLMDVPAKIMVQNAANEMLNSTTATNYNFNNLLINNRYRISPERPNTDWSNGVTTFDIALVSSHILGINTLGTPYQIIAADVNRSGDIDATDMLLMRRLILRQNVDFPNNNSWRFINKNYQFQDPTNPFASDFTETLIVPNLTNPITNGDFVAIKVGDVNGSLGSVNIRGGVEAFKLIVEDKALEKGKTYEIPIRLNPSAMALQYALNVDKKIAQIVNIASGDLPNCADNNFGLFKNEGIVTAAWNQSPNQKLSESDSYTMLYLTIKPTANTRLSDVLSINPVYTEGVAYDAIGTGAPVKLSFGNNTKVSDKLTLLPNRPNPFSDETMISFIMPETSVAKVTVCDLLGKVLMTTEKEFLKGINEVVFNAKTTPSVTSGILVVRLQTAKGMAEQKIVFSH